MSNAVKPTFWSEISNGIKIILRRCYSFTGGKPLEILKMSLEVFRILLERFSMSLRVVRPRMFFFLI